jgi:mono/diheme cytochrome c family protein
MRTIVLGFAVCVLLCASSFARQNAKPGHAPRSLLEQAPVAARLRPNPYAGDPDAFLAGQKLFRRHCTTCHGENSLGTDWAPSLRSKRIRNAPPGTLAWFLRNGDLRAGMPSWSQLPEERRWQIVTCLQADH